MGLRFFDHPIAQGRVQAAANHPGGRWVPMPDVPIGIQEPPIHIDQPEAYEGAWERGPQETGSRRQWVV